MRDHRHHDHHEHLQLHGVHGSDEPGASGSGISAGARRRALGVSLAVSAVILVAQVITGLVAGSLALLADSAHVASDMVALAVALVALELSARPPTRRHSYGLQRAEVVGALLNSALLLLTGAVILVEAAGRVGEEVEIAGGPVLVVASAGLLANVGSAWLVSRVAGRNMNLRAATAHLVVDAVGSLGAVVAAIAVLVADAAWVDTAISALIGVGVLVSAVRLLAGATHVLMEGSPAYLDAVEVADALRDQEGVVDVHHLHLWSLSSDVPALSAHVVLEGPLTLHEAQARGEELRGVLGGRFGVEHATLELECHPCEDEVH